MMFMRKINSKRGFTLAELLIVVAIIGILLGIGAIFIDPNDFSYVEANRNAESIATAAQNRLTELRNTGGIGNLQTLGVACVKSEESDETNKGGYRYIFSHNESGERNSQMSYILPFGSIDQELTDGYYAIGIQTDTGSIGEAFFSKEPFNPQTADYLISLASDESTRKSKLIGYYQGAVDDSQIAFAQLPTPQLTITNYENLSLSIYLPEVKELKEQLPGATIGGEGETGNVAIRVSLVDAEDKALEEGKLSLDDTAIYRTYQYDDNWFSQALHGVLMGKTYTMILDTPDDSFNDTEISSNLSDVGFDGGLKGKFEAWAKRTKAFTGKTENVNGKETTVGKYLKLGGNAKIYVTVFAVNGEGKIDPTFMPRSASVTFCSWFETFDDKASTATIACGRHLQNLGKLTEIEKSQAENLPTCTVDASGNYIYDNYSRGKAYLYTYNGDEVDEKYALREEDVVDLKEAKQVKAIDFDCDEWKKGGQKDGDPIPFTPINLPPEFTYYGNYLTIKHLYVDAPFYAGLFGYAYHQSLYDILLVNPHVVSHVPRAIAEAYEMGCGALIGTSRNSKEINNCQIYMEAEDGEYNSEKYRIEGECFVGGLIGFCEDEDIRQNSASVYVGYQAGGAKTSKFVGGLLGGIAGDSNIKRSYAAGYLTGEYVGGLVGVVMEDSDNSGDDYVIEGCYSAGHIESASESAAGLVGFIHEQGGYTKSAMRVKGNYCAVIYGVTYDNGKSYKWESTRNVSTEESAGGVATAAEKTEPVPIYGTFEGDNFEWLYSSDLGYFTGTFKDPSDPEGKKYLFGGYTMFFGADFEDDNQNYYIPQEGITYSNSDYFLSVKGSAEKLLEELNGANASNASALINDLKTYQNEIRREKLLQTLDKIDYEMRLLIEDMEAENAKDKNGTLYNACDKNENGIKWYLATNHAEFTTEENSNGDKTIKVTVLSALKAIYNGEGIDGGKITYENGSGYKDDKYVNPNSSDKEYINYTFRGLYALAKEAIEKNDETQINRLFGSDNDWTKGLFYRYFYSRLLHPLIDETKDYYQYQLTDTVGEQMYRYYRSRRVEHVIGYYLNSMACTTDALEAQLQLIKSKQLAAASGFLDTILEYSDPKSNYWNEEKVDSHYGMKAFKSTVYEKAKTAKTDLDNLISMVNGVTPTSGNPTTSPEEMQKAIEKAYASYNALYDYFNSDTKQEFTVKVNGKEKKVEACIKDLYGASLKAQKDSKGNTRHDDYGNELYEKKTNATQDMRGIRDALKNSRSVINLASVGINSGVEAAVERLIYLLKLSDSNYNKQDAIDECQDELNCYLGTNWEDTDSGHRIYTAEELRLLRHNDEDIEKINHDFRYDYGRTEGYEGKKDENGQEYSSHSYMDEDNGIYNNVFPYRENDFTKYYPFLMVRGMEVEDGSIATGVLFHYGDWLTQDLWTSPAQVALTEMGTQLSGISSALQAALDEAGTSENTGNIGSAITALKDEIDKCVQTINNKLDTTTDKALLTEIKETIEGWMQDGKNNKEKGVFATLKELVEENKDKPNAKDIIALLDIDGYETEINSILTKIEELLKS